MKLKKLAPGETRAIAVAVGITRRGDEWSLVSGGS